VEKGGKSEIEELINIELNVRHVLHACDDDGELKPNGDVGKNSITVH
jgi:hypothetical protein